MLLIRSFLVFWRNICIFNFINNIKSLLILKHFWCFGVSIQGRSGSMSIIHKLICRLLFWVNLTTSYILCEIVVCTDILAPYISTKNIKKIVWETGPESFTAFKMLWVTRYHFFPLFVCCGHQNQSGKKKNTFFLAENKYILNPQFQARFYYTNNSWLCKFNFYLFPNIYLS